MDGERQNSPNADGKFYNSLYFNWNDGQLNFDNNWSDNANQNYGSASGFLLVSLRLSYSSMKMALEIPRPFIS